MTDFKDFKLEPCSAEPRVFIGQVPFSTTFEEIYEIFTKYGNIKERQNPVTEGRKPNKGYAMVFYDNFTSAEAAVDAQNGKYPFGGSKPLIVKIAAPAKQVDGSQHPGIAPKKLFVGQIGDNTTDEQVKKLFSQYGTVAEYHRLVKKQGKGDCVFIGMSRWAECDLAIAGLNNQPCPYDPTKILTIKYANMHYKDGQGPNLNGPAATPLPLNLPTNMPFQLRQQLQQAAVQQPTYQTSIPQQEYAMPEQQYPQQYGIGAKRPTIENQLGGGQMGGLPKKPFIGAQPQPQSLNGTMHYSQAQEYADQAPQYGIDNGIQNGFNQFRAPEQSLPYAAQTSTPNLVNRPNITFKPPQQQSVVPKPYTLQAGKPQAQFGAMKQDNLTLEQSAKFKDWKLFVGQIPLDIDEYNLWVEFSKIGDIIDVAVLRNPDGKSKACAFVTYVDRQLAELAISTYHQQLPFHSSKKPLTVKFAG